jgi:Spy/CpxP family protein refolding chaperone
LAILIGSLTFIFAQTGKRSDGQFTGGEGRGFRPPTGMIGGGLPPQVLEKLNLSDQQKEQIKTLEDAARADSKAYFDKLKGFDEQLRTIADAGEAFNEEAARQILNGKAQVMTELELIRLKTGAAIKNLLTAEQKTQLEQLKLQRPEPPRGGRGAGFRPDIPSPVEN